MTQSLEDTSYISLRKYGVSEQFGILHKDKLYGTPHDFMSFVKNDEIWRIRWAGRSWDGAVGIITGCVAMARIPAGEGFSFHHVQIGFKRPPSLLCDGYRRLFPQG
jgi:hypothetical protein